MQLTKQFLLQQLPAYRNEWVTVVDDQDVHDIINEIEIAQIENAELYDKIGPLFIGDTLLQTCENLYHFCKDNLRYVEESEALQTVSTPQGLLTAGKCDCKGYASFIGGCMGAIERHQQKKINWKYCFASYKLFEPSPYHVFIVVETSNGPFYVDPTPGSYGKVPVWTVEREIHSATGAAVAGLGVVAGVTGELIPPPHWYPSTLPRFYRQSNGDVLLLPSGAIKYTENDVLDCLLYYQTWCGYNRPDTQNAVSAAWYKTDNLDGAKMRVVDQFKGTVQGNYNWVPNYNLGLDGGLYSQLQARYIQNELQALPWLSDLQAKGGIDLMTIPAGNDIQISRPTWYPKHLPSLFKSTGGPMQLPAGTLNTKPKIRSGYDPTPEDIAALMLYAQPVIYDGPTPYPMNWFVNDIVNGAVSTRYKITLWFHQPFTNSQAQQYGMSGDLMRQPNLDADPYASGFTKVLQTVVSAAVNFFAGKIPGGTKAVQAAYMAGSIGGGEVITGGPMPLGAFSAAVFQAADKLNTKIETTKKVNYVVLIALAAAGVLGYYYRDDLKKFF